VTLLDTGDPLNDERAQASLVVHVAGGEAMLLDTSSGTALLQRLCAVGIALGRIRHVFGGGARYIRSRTSRSSITRLPNLPSLRSCEFRLGFR
jgi:hypothetical protein